MKRLQKTSYCLLLALTVACGAVDANEDDAYGSGTCRVKKATIPSSCKEGDILRISEKSVIKLMEEAATFCRLNTITKLERSGHNGNRSTPTLLCEFVGFKRVERRDK